MLDLKESIYSLKGTHLDVGMATPVSPASFHPSVFVELVPLTPLVFRISAPQLHYFGLFENLVTYPGLAPQWHPETRDSTVTDDCHETGYRFRAEGTLRLAFGPGILLGKYERSWIGAKVDGDQSWYEPTTDMLYARDDRLDRVDATLGAFIIGRPNAHRFLLLGGRWQGQWSHKTQIHRQMGSALILWRPGWLADRKLTIASVNGIYLKDLYRQGGFYSGGFVSLSWDRLGADVGRR